MLDWIKSIGGHCVEIDTQRSDNHGPVKYMDGLHCIQKIGGANYIVHQLDHLDKVPALDDPKMEIRYRGGVGQVIGQLGKAVER